MQTYNRKVHKINYIQSIGYGYIRKYVRKKIFKKKYLFLLNSQ